MEEGEEGLGGSKSRFSKWDLMDIWAGSVSRNLAAILANPNTRVPKPDAESARILVKLAAMVSDELIKEIESRGMTTNG